MTAAFTLEHGQVAVFVAVDHASVECVGIHAALHGTRHEALEPIRQGVAERFGSVEKNAAEGLAIRHDHGSQYMSRDFQREIAWLGAFGSPSNRWRAELAVLQLRQLTAFFQAQVNERAGHCILQVTPWI